MDFDVQLDERNNKALDCMRLQQQHQEVVEELLKTTLKIEKEKIASLNSRYESIEKVNHYVTL